MALMPPAYKLESGLTPRKPVISSMICRTRESWNATTISSSSGGRWVHLRADVSAFLYRILEHHSVNGREARENPACQ